jgi:hypothetical protein
VREQLEMPDGPRLAALAAWRVTQGIYRFDEQLYAELWKTPLNDIPPQIFRRLPEWCVYIELNEPPFCGVLVHVNHDIYDPRQNRRPDQLRLLFLKICEVEVQSKNIGVITLDKPTIGEGFQSTREHVERLLRREGTPEPTTVSDVSQEMCASVASLVLYLCSQDADYTHMPRAEAKRTKDGIRIFSPNKPMVIDVGIRIGAALRRGKETLQRSNDTGEAGRPVLPHVRRAHWHHLGGSA